MTPIDWRTVQARLGVGADGDPGPITYTALISRMASGVATPTVRASLGNAAAKWCQKYGADASPARLADFLAQGANETGGFTRFEENLNYSAARLVEVWPSRFPTLQSAAPYAGNPQALANKVYGGRMGNTGPNDGWDYRGSGFLQLTGRSNWQAAEKSLGIGLDTNPEMARVPALSLLIALDFYTRNGVWVALDAGDTAKARRITNGGAIGLENVNRLRAVALAVLA